jgi:glycosyltransferase involved in cell wall biosynthesis
LSAARNTGIAAATNDWVLILDSDDGMEPEWLESASKLIQTDRDIISTNVQHCDAVLAKTSYVWWLRYTTPQALFNANDLAPATIFSKKIWEESGGFDESMRIGYEDWEFWVRLTNHFGGNVKIIKEKPMMLYRKYGESMSSNADRHRDELVAYIRNKNGTI